MKARRIAWSLLPLVVAAIAYAPSLRGGFVWDDREFLGRWISGGADFRSIFFPDPAVLGGVAYYHPFSSGSGYVLYVLFGRNALGWHAANVALHVLMTGGVFLLLRQLTTPQKEGRDESAFLASVLGAALFACWPATAEPVAWATARSEQLMGASIVWALVLHLRARDRGTSSLPAAALFFSALMSKETGIVFVPLAIGATWLVPRRMDAAKSGWRADLASALWLPHVLAYVAYSAMRAAAFRGHGSGESIVHLALSKLKAETLLPAVRAWGYYVREALLLGPGAPYVEYPPPLAEAWPYALAGALLVAASFLAARKPAGRPWAMAGWLFVIVLGPPLAVAAEPLSVTAVAIRYLYLPVVSIAIVAALLLRSLPEGWLSGKPAIAVSTGVLVLLSLMVQPRLEPWRTNRGLWARAVKDEPRSVLARVNHALSLGDPLAAQDQLRIAAFLCTPQNEVQLHMALGALAENYVSVGDYRGAATAMKLATRTRGSGLGTAITLNIRSALLVLASAKADKEKGGILVPRDELKAAAADLELARTLDPFSATVRVVLATIYEALDEPVRAITLYREIVKLSVANEQAVKVSSGRIEALEAQIAGETDPYRKAFFEAQRLEFDGKSKEALAAYERALAVNPDRVETLLAVASIEFESSRYPEAVTWMEKAAAVAPKDPTVQFNLGVYRLYAANGPGAAEALRRATELRPGWPKPHFHLGRALEMTGDYAGAAREYRIFLQGFEGPRQTVDMVESYLARADALATVPAAP